LLYNGVTNMRFSKNYKKLGYPIFTTIRGNRGYYKEGQTIKVTTPDSCFHAEIVSIRTINLKDITNTIADKDADCSKEALIRLMIKFYKDNADNLILITLIKVK